MEDAAIEAAVAKAAAGSKGKPGGQSGPEWWKEWKKCGLCQAWKHDSSFNKSQGRCAECNNTWRSLKLAASRQGEEDYIDTLQSSDEKQFRALVRAFSKVKNDSVKARTKVKFNVAV